MPLESWLPIQHELPDGALCGMPLYQGAGWQIIATAGEGRALVVKDTLHGRWLARGLIDASSLQVCHFGVNRFHAVSSGPGQCLAPVDDCPSPMQSSEALAFAMALQVTRALDSETGLQNALYVERLGRLLPTYRHDDPDAEDAVVLGAWLSGGVRVSVLEARMAGLLSWMSPAHLQAIVAVSGVETQRRVPALSLASRGGQPAAVALRASTSASSSASASAKGQR